MEAPTDLPKHREHVRLELIPKLLNPHSPLECDSLLRLEKHSGGEMYVVSMAHADKSRLTRAP